MKKGYYLCRLWQRSPLSLTNGEGEDTDLDLLLDQRGFPFIPGSSLAGILRSMVPSEEDQTALFGPLIGRNGEQEADGQLCSKESALIVSDAVLGYGDECISLKDIHISARDGVGINKNGSAEDGAKFDFQVVETDKPYTAILELTYHDSEDDTYRILSSLVEKITAEGIHAGQKTSRGYGFLEAEVYEKTFDLLKEPDSWLEFDPFAPEAFAGCRKIEKAVLFDENRIFISASLRFTGTFSVRVYSSDIGEADYRPLMSYQEPGKPVIPGTTWAGVFRHHMQQLSEQFPIVFPVTVREINELFGVPAEDEKPRKSQIIFHETIINGGAPMLATRIALDRFTMSPKNTALFTSEVWEGGNGDLEISLPAETNPILLQLLESSLLDLQNGLLVFGSEGNIGRGRAEIEHLSIQRNGKKSSTLSGCSLTGGYA